MVEPWCSLSGFPRADALSLWRGADAAKEFRVSEGPRRLPPLNNLIAFEASARLLSFTRAGQELNLSQAAVSRQIQGLEERLGTPLFQRQHKEIRLTRAGQLLLETATQSLEALRRTVNDIVRLETHSVTIAASLGLSSFWLLPEILGFREKHPEIRIRVVANDERLDPRTEAIDFAIRWGDGKWDGLVSEKLFDEEVFPVCSPGYLKRRGITQIDDIAGEELIDLDKAISSFGTWSNWLRKAGVKAAPKNIVLTLSNYDLVYRALCDGRGVGLAYPYAIPQEARDNLLVKPTNFSLKTGLGEFIVHPSGHALSRAASTVVDWLLESAKRNVWR